MVSVPRGWNWMWQQKRNSLDFLGKIAAVDGELIVESGQCLNCFYVHGVPRGRGRAIETRTHSRFLLNQIKHAIFAQVDFNKVSVEMLRPINISPTSPGPLFWIFPKNNHTLDRSTNSPMKAESDRQGLAGILWPLWPVSRSSGHLPFMGLLYSRLTC